MKVVLVLLTALTASGVMGATVSGIVIDELTGDPISSVFIELCRETYEDWVVSDHNGEFIFSDVPEGIFEIAVGSSSMAFSSAGYVSLDEIEIFIEPWKDFENRYISLTNQTATVTGYIRYADGIPAANAECYIDHHIYEIFVRTDANGKYEFKLPPGKYSLMVEELSSEEPFVSTGQLFTVDESDIGTHISGPDAIVYRSSEGGTISVSVTNPNHYTPVGEYSLMVAEAGFNFNLDTDEFYRVNILTDYEIELNTMLDISSLPPGSYDLYVIDTYEDNEEIIGGEKVLGKALGVSAGDSVSIQIDFDNAIISGKVMGANHQPLVCADLCLLDSSGYLVYGVTSDGYGRYEMPGLSPGNYQLMAVHRRYHKAVQDITISSNDTQTVNFNLTVFSRQEGADLSGDGFVSIEDFSIFASDWTATGNLPADFSRNNHVDTNDLITLAEFWLMKAFWFEVGAVESE